MSNTEQTFSRDSNRWPKPAVPEIVEPAVPEVAIAEPTVVSVAIVEPAVPEVAIVEPAVPEVAIAEPTVPEVAIVEPAVPEVAIVEPTSPPPTTFSNLPQKWLWGVLSVLTVMSIIFAFNSLSEPYEDVLTSVTSVVTEASASGEFDVGTGTYIVAEGDTLESIGRRFNTTTSQLRALNDLNTNFIYVDQQLKVSVDAAGDERDAAGDEGN